MKKHNLEKTAPYIAGLFSLIVYLFTIAPGVLQIDSGELAAVQSTLGIAHPTGYPLFTIVGYLFLIIPLPFTKIFQLNLLAAILCSLGILFFSKSILLLMKNLTLFKISDKKVISKKMKRVEVKFELSKETLFIMPIVGGLFLAFTRTFWFQATSVEVYSLQIFLFALIIFYSLKTFINSQDKYVDWLIVGFVTALGFSNHMTTLLSIPFIGFLFFLKEGWNIRAFKKLLVSLALFLPTLVLIYSYLPIRASFNPSINWGNPTNLENIIRHISGKQYQVWLFSSIDAAKKQLGYYLENLISEFTILGLVLAFVGIIYLYRKFRKLFWTCIVSFIVSVLYSINYDIVDIDSYFLFSYFILSIFIAFGLFSLIEIIQIKAPSLKKVIPLLFTIPLIPLILNFRHVDQSDQFTFEDYTKAILNFTEQNGIIFSYQWDYFISPSYYFQQVEQYRKDVAIVDKELLRRSWYYNQLENNHPEIIKNMGKDISDFLNALRPFERSENYDPNLLERNYRNIMTKLIMENKDRTFYIGLELYQNEMQRGEFTLPNGFFITPDIFFFKVTQSNEYIPSADPDFLIRFPKQKNKYVLFIEDIIGKMLSYRILYELQFNKLDRAKIYYEKIKKDLPSFILPAQIEDRIKLLN